MYLCVCVVCMCDVCAGCFLDSDGESLGRMCSLGVMGIWGLCLQHGDLMASYVATAGVGLL